MENFIGAYVKQYREIQGITQRQLADSSGVKYSTITKLEGGFIEDPSFLKISQISKALNISMDQLTFNLDTLGKRFELKSRRFLGNKYKLLGFIKKVIDENIGEFDSFFDPFAGTGVVGEFFNNADRQIISNDLLNSNFVPLKTFLGTTIIDWNQLNEKIKYLNSIVPYEENYVSTTFGSTYFSIENARRIGKIREEIDFISDDETEKGLLLTSLIYAMDKVANTVGHYDAYRKNLDTITPIKLLIPNVKAQNNGRNLIFHEDANKLVSQLNCDVLYIDPPYNSRQYSDAYHLLENIVEWKKPKVFGVAKKMNRDNLKSQYCLKTAKQAFEELISKCRAKHILLSYNNTGDSKHGRSNAKITDGEILEILSNKGEVSIFETEFKAFTTGKSKNLDNKERIFYCKVI